MGHDRGKGSYNPFIRAEDGDDPEDVRNGYVFDVGFYLTRFSLATPDIVVIEPGVNDTDEYDDDPEAIYAAVLADEALLYRRIRADLPSAKIIRMLPSAARAYVRDGLWPMHVAMIKAIMDAQIAAADADIHLAPTWAMATQDSGYDVDTAYVADETTGVVIGSIVDSLHPQTGTQKQLAKAIAQYIACAMDGTI